MQDGLAYRIGLSAGLQIFDLRFNGERIAYEIGVKEAIAFYSGRENSFESIDLKYVNFTNPWNPNDTIVQSKLHKTQHTTERSAAFQFGKKMPRYFHFYNPNPNPNSGCDSA
ncbi:unnamed protein product [Merluccius merluccius]